MGLDAVVYKNRSKLPLDPVRAGLRLEKYTGEWYSENGVVPEPFNSVGFRALHKRLGNVSLIFQLRAEVGCFLPSHSILLNNVLYEGGHAGDIIPLEKVGILRREIMLLREIAPTPSAELSLFLKDVEDLATAAEQNDNPIVFV